MTDWWLPAFQTTIDAYYRGDFAAGLAACERLLSCENLPEEIAQQTHRNLSYYTPPLAELVPATQFRRVNIAVRDGWSQFNPSIAADGDGFRMVVRSSNYAYRDSQTVITLLDPDNIARTENSLLTLDRELEVRSVQVIDDTAVRPDPPPFPVSGIEDLRLFRHQGAWWATGTIRDREPLGVCQIVLVRLADAVIADLRVLSDGSRHEKNWMPVVAGDGEPLRFVYQTSPTVILRYDDLAGTVVTEQTVAAPAIGRRFSGSTQVLPIDGGWLCLVHEGPLLDGLRPYFHRWVWFDAEWRLARLSPPFVFLERGVEFAAGLAQRGDDLIVSFGVWDRDAWLATLPLTDVLALLAAVRDPDLTEAELRAAGAVVPDQPAQTPAPAAPEVPVESTVRLGADAGDAQPDDVVTPVTEARRYAGLAESLAGEGRYDEAAIAYRVAASLEDGAAAAWALYRAAECLLVLGRPADAVAACTAGMAQHAGMAELPWLAGVASWRSGLPLQAAYWARRAIVLGQFEGCGTGDAEPGFSYPPARWELPYDVLRYALRATGDQTGSDEAERLFEAAKAARTSGIMSPCTTS